MEIAFIVICVVGCLAIAIGVGFALGKVETLNKLPDWIPGLIGIILVIGGLFASFWFVDAYKEHIIEQEHARQFENCKDNALTNEQCQYFQNALNTDL